LVLARKRVGFEIQRIAQSGETFAATFSSEGPTFGRF